MPYDMTGNGDLFTVAGTIVLAALGLFVAKVVVEKTLATKRALNAISSMPCREISPFDPFRPLALVVGSLYPRPGQLGSYYSYFSVYQRYGSSILSSVLFWQARLIFWLADANAIKVVTTEKHTFQKELESYEAVNIWGKNLATTEGSNWKRRRVIANPAFNEANTALVWSEANRLLGQWFSDIWSRKDILDDGYPLLDLNFEITQFTLFILISATFGHRSTLESFKEQPFYDSQRAMPLHTVLSIVIENILFRYLLPTPLANISLYVPIPYLSKHVRKVERAIKELRLHVFEMISTARASVAAGDVVTDANAALLRNLVEANMKQEGEYRSLTDQELLCDIFIFLLAGHETSSHALAFAITLIAFYPDVQRMIYEEVKSVWPNGSPALGAKSIYKEDFHKLVYTQATFRETLRHHPVIPRLNKYVAEETTLTGLRFTPNTAPTSMDQTERFEVHLPKGSLILMDFQAIHMNLLPFSAGARMCIGTRFAMSESVAILANLVHSYEILLPTDAERKLKEMENLGVGVVERMKWLCAWSPGVTNTPARAKVRIRKRNPD